MLLLELDRFDETNMKFIGYMTCLNHKDDSSSFDKEKIVDIIFE